MKKQVWYGTVIAACILGILLGILAFVRPLLRQEEAPNQSQVYYLRDEGGRVAVYAGDDDASPLAVYDIYVNLLPEGDVLRLKAGLRVEGDAALERLLEDLGA